MNTHTIDLLEFNEIKEWISKYIKSYYGKEELKEKGFICNKKQLENELNIIDSLIYLYSLNKHLPLEPLHNINDIHNSINQQGIINVDNLLEIKRILRTYNNLKNFFKANKDNLEIILNIYKFENDYSDFNKRLKNTIGDEGEILDSASNKLFKIRREIARLKEKIFSNLNKFFSNSKYKDVLAGESYILKDGKYLLPVSPSKRKKIDGIIQDTSSTGRTLFMETYETIEINNQIKEQIAYEKEEIYKILQEITKIFLQIVPDIEDFLQFYRKIDLFNAKATLCNEKKYNKPIISDYYDLKNFYHPFLKNPVKNSVLLNNKNKLLIISGPNTGGKTVTLKTIGMIQLMVQFGLFIPAEENSIVNLVDDIFVDIGDQQSIEKSISTFSSHIINIKNILEKSTEKSLILLDEIGTGTSPTEGEALSCAIIEKIYQFNCYSIVTSHYKKVKLFADNYENIRNASMEFDTDSMKPKYKLLLDVPGASYAFFIANNLGLQKEIIEKAKDLMGDGLEEEEYILTLQEKINNYEKLAEEMENKLKDLSIQKKDFEKQEAKFRSKAKTAKDDVKEELFREITDLRKIVERRISNIKKYGYDKEKSKDLIDIINAKKNKLENNYQCDNLKKEETKVDYKVNDLVYIKSMQKEGKITEIKKGKIKVLSGIFTLEVKPDDIEIRNQKKKSKDEYNKFVKSKTSNRIPYEIDIRGHIVEEAEHILEDYFDNLVFTNYEKVYIIHGKGEGKLQRFVQDYLKNNPFVSSFEFARPEEGGTGCTVASLKL